jgi:DNA invertase Pin-like site-specific DNA recombinase
MKKLGTTTRRSGTVRCAIYTRKSSEEGLEQEFNSLQAQREACEVKATGDGFQVEFSSVVVLRTRPGRREPRHMD